MGQEKKRFAGKVTEGRVTQVLGVRCKVKDGDRTFSAIPGGRLGFRVRGKKNLVAVGDWVRVIKQSGRAPMIEEVLPRRNKLSRRMSYMGTEHVIAANLDLLCVMLAPMPSLRTGLLDRYLVAAFHEDIPVLILCNKMDLQNSRDVERILGPYEELGHRVLPMAALTGEGLDSFLAEVRGKWSVIMGHSGVGKTTLLNTLFPDLDLPVGEVAEESGKGKHTTEKATGFFLDDETVIVDTAGIREFAPYGVGPLEVETAFTDVHEIGASCRYPTCTHRMEPECSVKKAVKQGSLSIERYESYTRLVDDTELQKEEDRVRRDSEGSPERALRRSEDRDRELIGRDERK